MLIKKNEEGTHLRILFRNRFFTTSLFCVAVALVTNTVWQGELYVHFIISLGYGFSGMLSAAILQRIFPHLVAPKSTLISMLCGLLLGTLNASLWLQRYEHFSTLESLKPVIFLGIIFTAICFYLFHTNEQKAIADKALEVAKRQQSEQEKALILSQLNQLQSQIEPHFLFNTLANIQALMELDTKRSSMMLSKLTELLRGTLSINRSSLTNLEQETQLLNAYLDIQKIRLDDRLSFRFDNQINEEIALPPFLIQPLVENAIRHGIEPSSQGGEIIISYKIEAQNLIINISDSGLGLQENNNTKGNGMSLTNIKQRLAYLFEQQATLSITENSLGGVSSILSIPLTQLNKLHREQS